MKAQPPGFGYQRVVRKLWLLKCYEEERRREKRERLKKRKREAYISYCQ